MDPGNLGAGPAAGWTPGCHPVPVGNALAQEQQPWHSSEIPSSQRGDRDVPTTWWVAWAQLHPPVSSPSLHPAEQDGDGCAPGGQNSPKIPSSSSGLPGHPAEMPAESLGQRGDVLPGRCPSALPQPLASQPLSLSTGSYFQRFQLSAARPPPRGPRAGGFRLPFDISS